MIYTVACETPSSLLNTNFNFTFCPSFTTMASSSSQKHHHSLSMPTTAPPPTPSSTQPSHFSSSSSSEAADALSHLLLRLPPSLSLPTRLSPPTTTPPPIPFSSQTPSFLHPHLPSITSLGYFQLTNHPITSQLAHSAESESLSLFTLPSHQKHHSFTKTWPLGYDDGDGDDDDDDSLGESFCLALDHASSSTESTQSLNELARELDKLGAEIVESLACAVGFYKQLREIKEPRFCSLMWISEGVTDNKPKFSGRFYPYVIALQYQIRCRKYSMLADSGWVSVSPQVDSVLVTLGDIAQVWSNGKLKKVRGRPLAVSGKNENSRCVTMSLLVTLPTDTGISISPLLPGTTDQNDNDENEVDESSVDDKLEKKKFKTFSFEDYAWRVYHERFLFMDTLDRYRI